MSSLQISFNKYYRGFPGSYLTDMGVTDRPSERSNGWDRRSDIRVIQNLRKVLGITHANIAQNFVIIKKHKTNTRHRWELKCSVTLCIYLITNIVVYQCSLRSSHTFYVLQFMGCLLSLCQMFCPVKKRKSLWKVQWTASHIRGCTYITSSLMGGGLIAEIWQLVTVS